MASFEGDPNLVGVDPSTLAHGRYEVLGGHVNGAFGIPLVAGWRSLPPPLESAYRLLVDKVSSCFDSTTGCESKNNGNGRSDEPEAHIYPFEDLHVTIVTFRTLLDPAPASEEHAAAIKEFCVKVVENSTKKDKWPKGNVKLQLRPKEVCLWKKNAVILWEETTGNLETMRLCLKEEMESQKKFIDEDILSGISMFVPNIVHSTFMRFWKTIDDEDGCSSKPGKIKQLFEESGLIDVLPNKIDVDSNATLVCEDTPCMHISNDDSHILWKEK